MQHVPQKLHHVIKYYKRKIDTKIIYAQIMIRDCQLIEKLSLFLFMMYFHGHITTRVSPLTVKTFDHLWMLLTCL